MTIDIKIKIKNISYFCQFMDLLISPWSVQIVHNCSIHHAHDTILPITAIEYPFSSMNIAKSFTAHHAM